MNQHKNYTLKMSRPERVKLGIKLGKKNFLIWGPDGPIGSFPKTLRSGCGNIDYYNVI